jgi:hypothetical protein
MTNFELVFSPKPRKEPINNNYSLGFMNISNAAKEVLGNLAEAILQLTKSEYSLPIPRLGNSTLGEHVRHTLEFFICLKEGTVLGKINYDERRRDKSIENNPEIALSTIKTLQQFIGTFDDNTLLKLEVDYGLSDSKVQVIDTNFNRELAYNIEHAVHHMAILKIGLAEVAPEVSIPNGFGIAVSTLRFRKEQVHHT